MTNKPTRKYEEMPDAVLDFAYGLDGMEQMENIETKYDLKDEASSVLYDVLDNILKGELGLGDLLSRIENGLDVGKEKAKKIRLDFAGNVLLPISIVFDGLEDQIKEWGGDLEKFKDVEKIELPQKTAEEYLDEVLEEKDLKTGVDRLDSRLMSVLKPYVTNTRSREQVIETLQKSIKTGGLDLSKDRAQQLVDEVGEELRFFDIGQKSTIIKAADKNEESKPDKEGSGESDMSLEEEFVQTGEVDKNVDTKEEQQESESGENDDLFGSPSDGVEDSDLFGGEKEPDADDKEAAIDKTVTNPDVEEVPEESEKEPALSEGPGAQSVTEKKDTENKKDAEQKVSSEDKRDNNSKDAGEKSQESKRIKPPPIVSKVSTEITEPSNKKDENSDVKDQGDDVGANGVRPDTDEDANKKQSEDEKKEAEGSVQGGGNDTDKKGDFGTEKPEKTTSIKDDLKKEVEKMQSAPKKETNKEGKGESKTEKEDVENVSEEKSKEAKKTNKGVLERGNSVDVFSEEDEKEIEQSKEKTQKIHEKVGPAVDLKSAVKNVLKRDGVEFEDEEMKKRFRNIVETRMRDIRDAYETRAKLESGSENGGMGLSGAKLADVMQVIEDVFVEYHEALKGEAKQKTKDTIKEQSKARDERKRKEMEKREKEKEERYKKIHERTQKKQQPKKDAEPAGDEQLVDLDQIKKAAQKEAEKSNKKERPKMQDVRFEQKLSGPVEQLASMRLVDFRRLSSNPEKAIKKIMDDIDLLENDGYDKRIAGIKAWRKSPVSQEYARLSRESLSTGKSLERIVKEKQGGESETLNWKEVQAIMELNSQLRF